MEFWCAALLRFPVFPATRLPAGTFDLQGRGGTRGLHPENTIAGCEQAIELGATAIETDLIETDLGVIKNGVLGRSHAPKLNPDLLWRIYGVASCSPTVKTTVWQSNERIRDHQIESALAGSAALSWFHGDGSAGIS